MKKLFLAFMALALSVTHNASAQYVEHVDPMIGSGDHGHVFVGANVPWGMVNVGPVQPYHGWDWCSGYHVTGDSIVGFSHTHLSGTGGTEYGDFLIIPTVGKQEPDGGMFPDYASGYSHASEIAEPGYYSVLLERYGVKAELTATERTALHRYTFPQSDSSGFILDLDYVQQYQTNVAVDFKILDSTTLQAYRRSSYWAYDQELFFYAKFDKPLAMKLCKMKSRLNANFY